MGALGGLVDIPMIHHSVKYLPNALYLHSVYLMMSLPSVAWVHERIGLLKENAKLVLFSDINLLRMFDM